VKVASSDTNLVASVKTLVENYNKVRQKLAELTAYNAADNKRAVLTGDATALRLDTELASLVSGSFGNPGDVIRTLKELGITLKQDGTLELDENQLKAAYAADPTAVRRFFVAENTGLSARFDRLLDQLAGENSSLLATRLETLRTKVAHNEQRLAEMDQRLRKQGERLYLSLYRMEQALAKLKGGLSYLDAIQPLSPIVTWMKR
jgi:flagellar hook-associated protein 2